MSASPSADSYIFLLDGKEQLGADFDEFADVLYLCRGDEPVPAISLTSNEGHLVRINDETGEIVGFTIFGWDGELNRGTIQVTVPVIARSHDEDEDDDRATQPQTHELELVLA